jgi:hypothetical protein
VFAQSVPPGGRGSVRRFLAAVSIVAVCLVGFAQPAGAVKPEKGSFHDSFRYTDHTCGFGVRVHERFEGTSTTYFDKHGKFIRSRTHITYHGTWTNEDSGAWLAEEETLNTSYHKATRTYRVLGLNWHFKLPSGRTVVIDAGRLIYDRHFNLTFEAGKHEIVDSNFDLLCPYLA